MNGNQANAVIVLSGVATFEFNGKRVRTAGTPDEPLFCAADVCEVLGLVDNTRAVNQALEPLDPEDVVREAVLGSKGALYTGPGVT